MKRRSEHLVRKRDGRTEFLRATKLARSIHQAMQSVGIDEDWRAIELANVVLTALQQRAGSDAAERPAVAAAMLNTESIADAVQHVLVATGQAHAAVAYGAVAAERARRHRTFSALGQSTSALGRSAAVADEAAAKNRAAALVRANRFGQE